MTDMYVRMQGVGLHLRIVTTHKTQGLLSSLCDVPELAPTCPASSAADSTP
jgi:hypothetical protein